MSTQNLQPTLDIIRADMVAGSDGTLADETNNYTGQASVALYDYIGNLYGIFTKYDKYIDECPVALL
jgi:hypothetical protein